MPIGNGDRTKENNLVSAQTRSNKSLRSNEAGEGLSQGERSEPWVV